MSLKRMKLVNGDQLYVRNNIPYLSNEVNYSFCSDHPELLTIKYHGRSYRVYEDDFVATISWKNRNSGSKCMMGKAV